MGGKEAHNVGVWGRPVASMLAVIWRTFLFIFILNAPLTEEPKLGKHVLKAGEKDPSTLRLSSEKY